jgi:hypothetical protein
VGGDEDEAPPLSDEDAELAMLTAYLERHCSGPAEDLDDLPPGAQSGLCDRLRQQQDGPSLAARPQWTHLHAGTP